MKNQILKKMSPPVPQIGIDEDYAALPREYRRTGALSQKEVVALLVQRLEDYGTGVYLCGSRNEIKAMIASVLRLRDKKRLAIPKEFPREWLPEGFGFIPDDNLAYPELERMQGAVTACAVGIAETGTIVLAHTSKEGRRALTLLPDYHLCLLFEDQVYQTVPQAARAADILKSRLLTTVSGPSATSDIEMIRVQGVHGPRSMDVVVCAGLVSS